MMLFTATTMFAQDENLYIFLCFGQSNMEGQGKIETQDYTVDSRFQVLQAVTCGNLRRTKGVWYTATPPLCRAYTGLCPVDYFGRTMVANLPSNIRVGVVNVSVAGCKIELFDKDKYQAYALTVPSWMTGIINEYGGNPFAHLVEIAKLAQKDGVIKGILLHQGESNTGDNAWPSKVKKVYSDLIAALNLDSSKVPLLAGEVVNADQGGVCAGANAMIAKLPQTLPNSYVISSKGCTDTTDNIHFNSAGYRELGKRYAVKMLSLLGVEVTAVQRTESVGSEGYLLRQNYPNPFNPSTTISFSLPSRSFVTVKIYDALGREIAQVLSEELPSGNHSRQWQPNGIASGIYFYRLQAGTYAETRMLQLLK
ncbi:MAG TPA: sialate O-acetylesterase [Bacteroidota bacterium]|nr:sialate O-acetylesterase [Bacteroidota bacterium]